MRMGFCLDFSLPGGVGGEAGSQQVKGSPSSPPEASLCGSVDEAPGEELVPSLGAQARGGGLLA